MNTSDFLTALFEGHDGGYLDIARASPGPDGTPGPVDRQRFYELPHEWDMMLTDLEFSTEEDLYFSPILYSTPRRAGDDADAKCRVVYADADTFQPEDFRVPPTFSVETSVGHWHCYWLLDKWHTQAEVSRISSKLPKAHGIDSSSGIPTKLLRVPGSTNSKYAVPFTVEVRSEGDTYTLEELDAAYADITTGKELSRAEMEVPKDLPERFELADRVPSDTRLGYLLQWDKKDQVGEEATKRSERRWEALRLALEAGFTGPEAASLVWGTPLCDHYREQGRPFEHFWQFDVLKALAQEQGEAEPVELIPATHTAPEPADFLSLPELQMVLDEPGFVDRWVDEARTHLHPKTPEQYLVANSYMVLACGLSHRTGIVAPNSTRRQDANLYVLNAGPSTTGKTEALFHMMRYTDAISALEGHEVFVGTNATAEGLVKALVDYNGKSAMMVTDEVSSKFKEWAQKGSSQSTMYELELSLYDGRLPKALRATKGAGNTKDVRVAYNQYGMGTPVEMLKHLTTSFLRSGYTARNVVVMAERADIEAEDYLEAEQGDVSRVEDNDPMPHLIAEDFQKAFRNNSKFANGNIIMHFEPDAFDRFKRFRWELVQNALAQPDPEVARLHAERMGITAQKMMALCAYERVAGSIQMIDVLRVLRDVSDWWKFTLQMIHSVSESEFGRVQEELLAWLLRRGGSVSSAELHTHLSSVTPRERNDIIGSLESRHMLKRGKGKGGMEMFEVAS